METIQELQDRFLADYFKFKKRAVVIAWVLSYLGTFGIAYKAGFSRGELSMYRKAMQVFQEYQNSQTPSEQGSAPPQGGEPENPQHPHIQM